MHRRAVTTTGYVVTSGPRCTAWQRLFDDLEDRRFALYVDGADEQGAASLLEQQESCDMQCLAEGIANVLNRRAARQMQHQVQGPGLMQRDSAHVEQVKPCEQCSSVRLYQNSQCLRASVASTLRYVSRSPLSVHSCLCVCTRRRCGRHRWSLQVRLPQTTNASASCFYTVLGPQSVGQGSRHANLSHDTPCISTCCVVPVPKYNARPHARQIPTRNKGRPSRSDLLLDDAMAGRLLSSDTWATQ